MSEVSEQLLCGHGRHFQNILPCVRLERGLIMDLWTAIKLGLAVAKTVKTGKTAKTLEKIENGVELAEKVKELFPKKPKKESK